ncbi:hypothetical protein Tsubulata_005772 [Turnera subulata]|uniref:ubiquitinyl hydrolase 1 n=1 Tax=Turnera subulata TaxID=218843 RepID=A0A9Q0F7M8_9ROSI|nr:hypothetical protein Tsubulata_005772 [Turnera subulata]
MTLKVLMDSEKTQIYHERQKLQFCLLHALNNLFQRKEAFTRASLDAVAEMLVLDDPTTSRTWTPLSMIFKPHHNAFTGNYDINVLIAALEDKHKTVAWHDRRNGASTIDIDGSGDTLFGIVLNVPVRRYAGIWKTRHWVAMRKIDGVWYNLDSDFTNPVAFQDNAQVREFLDFILGQGGEVLLVLNKAE